MNLMSSRTEPKEFIKHLPELDGVRGLAIILVLLTHFLIDDRSTMMSCALSKIGSFGWVGVDLFFVLSGFLITGILLKTKDSTETNYFINFYARRSLRIFPLYYGVLFIVFIMLPLASAEWKREISSIALHQCSLWLYLSNFDITAHLQWLYSCRFVSMNHFWSLAVEEQFYLIWPWAVYFLNRRTLMGIALAAGFIALFLRYYWSAIAYNSMACYVLMPCRMDSLAFGAFVALSLNGPHGLSGLLRPAVTVFILSAFTCLAVYMEKKMWSTSVLGVTTIGISAQSLLFASGIVLLLAASRESLPKKFFMLPWLRLLGKYSYGLYVFHNMLLPALCIWFPLEMLSSKLHSVGAAQIGFFMIGTLISLSISVLSYNFFEKPFLNLKSYFN